MGRERQASSQAADLLPNASLPCLMLFCRMRLSHANALQSAACQPNATRTHTLMQAITGGRYRPYTLPKLATSTGNNIRTMACICCRIAKISELCFSPLYLRHTMHQRYVPIISAAAHRALRSLVLGCVARSFPSPIGARRARQDKNRVQNAMMKQHTDTYGLSRSPAPHVLLEAGPGARKRCATLTDARHLPEDARKPGEQAITQP